MVEHSPQILASEEKATTTILAYRWRWVLGIMTRDHGSSKQDWAWAPPDGSGKSAIGVSDREVSVIYVSLVMLGNVCQWLKARQGLLIVSTHTQRLLNDKGLCWLKSASSASVIAELCRELNLYNDAPRYAESGWLAGFRDCVLLTLYLVVPGSNDWFLIFKTQSPAKVMCFLCTNGSY